LIIRRLNCVERLLIKENNWDKLIVKA